MPDRSPVCETLIFPFISLSRHPSPYPEKCGLYLLLGLTGMVVCIVHISRWLAAEKSWFSRFSPYLPPLRWTSIQRQRSSALDNTAPSAPFILSGSCSCQEIVFSFPSTARWGVARFVISVILTGRVQEFSMPKGSRILCFTKFSQLCPDTLLITSPATT